MTERDILHRIDEGANYYISLFADAEHMETVRKEHYSCIKPRGSIHGIKFVYNITIDGLPAERQKEIVAEIKALGMPYWLDLCSSDQAFRLFFDRDRQHGQRTLSESDEIYMAMLPDELPSYSSGAIRVIRAQSPEEFAAWANIANGVLAGGLPDMHPIYHYHLCKEGTLRCYIACDGDTPAATAAIMDNKGIASLEFVATLPEMRRRGFAGAACRMALNESFAEGAQLVTVRAIDGVAARLYEALGFKTYNHVI